MFKQLAKGNKANTYMFLFPIAGFQEPMERNMYILKLSFYKSHMPQHQYIVCWFFLSYTAILYYFVAELTEITQKVTYYFERQILLHLRYQYIFFSIIKAQTLKSSYQV